MKTRLITAAIWMAFGYLVLYFSEMNSIVLGTAIAIFCGVICSDFLCAKGLQKKLKLFIPCVAFAVIIPGTIYLPGVYMTPLMYIPIYVFVLFVCMFAVFFHTTISVEDMLFSFFGVLLIAVSFGVYNIRSCADNKFTSFWAILIMGIPWLSDSAAYFAGSAFGKHKLCPNISPKKTVEGAIGGVIVATTGPLLVGYVFSLIYGNVYINYAILPVIGFINSLISIGGDLLFSIVKRYCGIKDYGNLMPGHGGLLDRFDSVILCSTSVLIFSQYFTIIAEQVAA